MKLALIPPIEQLYMVNSTRTYHLMLAHLVVNYPDYKKFYTYVNDDEFLILDNGAAEGATVSWDELVELAEGFAPDEVVFPDVMGEMSATLNLFVDCWNKWQALEVSWDPMVVVQGQTNKECQDFIHQIADISGGYVTLGIPRHLLKRTGDKFIRANLASWAKSQGYDGAIHALGASSFWPEEIGYLQTTGFFRGMDTSMPFVYAMNNLTYPQAPFGPDEEPQRPANYFEGSTTVQVHDLMTRNVEAMEKYIDGQ